MKMNIEIDCSPEEARALLGLPDVTKANEAYVENITKLMKGAGGIEQLQELALELKLPLCATWPDLSPNNAIAPHAWAQKVGGADVIMVMEKDVARTKQLIEPNEAITLHIVKNRGGERGKLGFDFYPAFAKFVETE
jgi:hypothetical protein